MNKKDKDQLLQKYSELVNQMSDFHEYGSNVCAIKVHCIEAQVALMEEILKKLKVKIQK